MKFLRPILALATRPAVTLAVGCILVITNLIELGETLYTFAGGVEGEHGGVLLGLVLALKSISEADDQLQKVAEAKGLSLETSPSPRR